MTAYNHLHQLSTKIKHLQGVSHILEWDQETYMPSGASQNRSEQLELLSGIIHGQKTSEEYRKALANLVDLQTGVIHAQSLNDEQQAAVREWHRDYRRDHALPLDFVEEWAKTTSQSLFAWRQAKKENSFQAFAPFLDKIITMNRKKADYLGYKDHPYDALLDLYEPGITTKEISNLFDPLKTSIKDLLKHIQSKPQIDASFLYGNFSQAKQVKFGKKLLKEMGYSLTNGRLDFSTHPFSTSSHPTDSRITTRIDPHFILSNISVILHEAGHGMYEMNLPIRHFGSPLGEALSLGMHESQSRWWETRIGHSRAFWEHYLPQLKKAFKGKFDAISLNDFYKGINNVQPSFIRVEADEVTYSLHVILRFEMEKALIEGSLKIRDIPDTWNAKMKDLLGITPKTNQEGCLQDVHWSMGAFGYFPSYTLGNLYASQFFETFKDQHPDWEKQIAQGNLLFIKDWLRENVHQHGRRYSSKELIEKVTKKPFSAAPYIAYLKEKYTHLY